MNKLSKVEQMIDELIYSIVNNDVYKSPKAEERLTALCLARMYMLDKCKQNGGNNEG